MIRWLRLWAITQKELRQLARDRLTFGMVVMIPLIQLLLFGYAINTDVRHIPVGLLDMSRTADARLLVEAIKATQVVSIARHYEGVSQAEAALTRGEVRAVLVLPADLPRRLGEGRPVGQWLVDGSDTLIASALLGLRSMPLTELDPKLTQPPVSLETVLYFNPSRRSAINIVPGLLGVILTMTMIMFTSAAIVRERERGNLELLITTPVTALELMLGKILPYIGVGLVQVAIILGLGHLIFAVPINGALSQVLLATLLFIAASLTLGLLISTLAQTQLQAMQMTVFILLPSILLSGFMFPYEGMPVPAQWVAELLPATHFMRIIRGIVLRGGDLASLWQDALWLGFFAVAVLLLAAHRFKKSLD
jgi:ABC-2 type transport system permease protein